MGGLKIEGSLYYWGFIWTGGCSPGSRGDGGNLDRENLTAGGGYSQAGGREDRPGMLGSRDIKDPKLVENIFEMHAVVPTID